MQDLSQFKFKYPIQMRWKDMDALGHVNNAVYITYFEVARGYYMMEAAPGWDWHKHMFLIANVEVAYQKELRLSASKAEVWMRTSKIGNKSFELEYVVVSEVKGQTVVHASGTTVQVMFDLQTKKTTEIHNWVREGLTAYEN